MGLCRRLRRRQQHHGLIAPGETRTGEFGITFDSDWFRIDLTAGETYAITLQRESAPLSDGHVSLVDSDGNFIDFNHDQLVHTVSADGTYFIAVDDGSGETGTYDPSVELLVT